MDAQLRGKKNAKLRQLTGTEGLKFWCSVKRILHNLEVQGEWSKVVQIIPT